MRLFISILILIFSGSSLASQLVVKDAYAYPTIPGMGSGAVYAKFINNGTATITLVSAKTDVAKSAELHSMKMENDRMYMRNLKKLEVKAQQEVELSPTGLHIMLIQLHKALVVGQKFTTTVVQDDDKELQFTVEVIKPDGEEMHDHAAHNHQHHHHDHDAKDGSHAEHKHHADKKEHQSQPKKHKQD